LTTGRKKDARSGERLYNRVAVLRAERGLSRQRLADAIGVNYQTIGYLERGDYKASLELAFRLTEFFKLPLSAIFSRKPFCPMSDELFKGTNKVESSSKHPERRSASRKESRTRV
jgi:DNA-binding XRE family transcriptional regulator